MEINFHPTQMDAVSKPHAARPVQPRETNIDEEAVAFENARALRSALDEIPEVRSEAVRRATELLGDVNYPPAETIRMISHLLAIQLHADGGQR